MNISIEKHIDAPIDKVWEYWTKPNHITQWNFASEDWHCPIAKNELTEGKKFGWRMEAKDGSMGFDFEGTYTKILFQKLLEYRLGDDRFVRVLFEETEDGVKITESFEAEGTNSDEQQRLGWLAILKNFKSYVESN